MVEAEDVEDEKAADKPRDAEVLLGGDVVETSAVPAIVAVTVTVPSGQASGNVAPCGASLPGSAAATGAAMASAAQTSRSR